MLSASSKARHMTEINIICYMNGVGEFWELRRKHLILLVGSREGVLEEMIPKPI